MPAFGWLTLTLVRSYIFVPQGLGAAVIDAAFNFALGKTSDFTFVIYLMSPCIASAMYRTTRKEIRLWPLESTLSDY